MNLTYPLFLRHLFLLYSEATNHAPTATQPTYRLSNADAHPRTLGAVNHTSHSALAVRAPEQSPTQGSTSTSSLKRGPDTPDQSAEVPSKRIKAEPIETSLWDSSVPDSTSQKPQPIVPTDGKRKVDSKCCFPGT